MKKILIAIIMPVMLSCNFIGTQLFNIHIPQPNISGPDTGIINQEITITAKDTVDLDQDSFTEFSYSWIITGPSDSTVIQKIKSNPDFIFSANTPGEYKISVTVSDGKNLSDTVSKTVHIYSDRVYPMLVNRDTTPEFRFTCDTNLFKEFHVQLSSDPQFTSVTYQKDNLSVYQFEITTELPVGNTYYLRARGLTNDGKTWSSWDYLNQEIIILGL